MTALHEHDGYKPHSHEVRADHRGVETGHEVTHYTWGYNQNGTGQWSVIQVHADGYQAVILEGEPLTETKVKAIAMILNAPEPS